MPNISDRNPRPDAPRNLDDLRANPSMIVTTADLARVGIARSYYALKSLPPPLKLPGRTLAWEARTILAHIGAKEVVADA